jgi:PAS domain S-box-containing protein
MMPTPTFDEIFAVMSAASVGDTSARVAVPDDTALDNPATQLAVGLNLLLDDLAFRSAERERAIGELRRSEASFRLLFENNPLPMWVYELETLEFIEVNDAAVAHYGYTREEFLAMRITDIRPAEDVPRLLEDLATPRLALQSSGEWRHRRKNGDVIDVQIASHRFTFNGRDAVLVVSMDVTERKQAQAALVALNLELERRVADRTAQLEAANTELEAFSYSVAHDLRAPLRAMDGFSRLVIDEYASQLPGDAQRYLDRVRQGAQQMGLLIDDLLTFARLARQPIHRQRVDMNGLVHLVADQLLGQHDGGPVALTVDNLPDAHADASLLRQVFINLLSNALKFSRTRADPRIDVTYQPGGGKPVYAVRDNGVGFDMRYADKLFGVFQRLHRTEEYEGTGVGLAIVQRIIHRHGGRVWAEAQIDKGAAFYFTLGGDGDGERPSGNSAGGGQP